MKTKEIHYYLSRTFSEKDWINPPQITFSEKDPSYVLPNEMKKSKGILYSSCSESDSILFIIQTISKNIIFHIRDSQRDLFITFYKHRLSWMERGAIQKICICHSNEIYQMNDYIEYMINEYQISKIMYLGKLEKKNIIGICEDGFFTYSPSHL